MRITSDLSQINSVIKSRVKCFKIVTVPMFIAAGMTFTAVAQTPLTFVPVTPCRIADTRNPAGPFGAPSIAGQATRNFVIPSSSCSIPATAQAYSLNIAVVPQTALGYLTMWPAGQTQPLVSTINSDGRVKSNAAIVPAGTGGAISIFASNTTDVVLDIDGYFVPNSAAGSLAFYPLSPCRIADTRNPVGSLNLGGPYLSGGQPRNFAVLASSCNVPAAAQSYSLNFTAVPRTGLGYLTTWAAGQTQPLVSTLNAPTGTVTANAAIVPAGAGGAISVFASNDSDLVIDINGYFAPQGSAGALALYAVSPCRALDTRLPAGSSPFSGNLNINVAGSTCAPPSNAQSYVFNATVVPSGAFGYLTLYGHGATQPLASTLNASDGAVSGNLAFVPTSDGSVTAFASNPTHLVMDLSAYFAPAGAPPVITDFSPKSGAVGTLITLTGAGLSSASVTLAAVGGGTLAAPLSTSSATSLSFVIPAGAATGAVTVAANGVGATSTSTLTITPSSTFTISAAPASANLIMGQSVTYAVQMASGNGFSQLAPLSVSGLPSGVSAAFKPASITAGQMSILTLTAPANQAAGPSTLSISAAATVDGIPLVQTAPASVTVQAPTTSFLGRAVGADQNETPLAGVTVTMLGLDGNGSTTGCTGNTVSDAGGNFALTGLAANCVGPQLIGFGGTKVTSPPGTYAGVQLVFTLVSGKVVVSPVLVHLPRIDNVETFLVTQNSSVDQNYTFKTIPNLSVIVYAGTTLTEQDGTKPNPFPLAAVQVPVDRLPDVMPATTAGVAAFIVAFQPAEANSNKAVAVWFPNTLNTPPGTDVPLMTLDPTKGRMVPYGTGTVSSDGTTIIPDIDPSTGALNHRYGLVHFDWHGPVPPGPPINPSGGGGGPGGGGNVDLGSGLEVYTRTDIGIRGNRGNIRVIRTYRTLSTESGAFGLGSNHNFNLRLDSVTPQTQAVVSLIMPDGNRLPFARQTTGLLICTTIPSMIGAVMQTNADGTASVSFRDGTVFGFQPGTFPIGSVLVSITDPNRNTTVLTRSSSDPNQITTITDPVGRQLQFTYDSGDRVASITDPIGRKVSYAYNSAGLLTTVTDVAGGLWTYEYDAQNRLTQTTDPRGIHTYKNVYDGNGRVVQQTQADGAVMQFAYVTANSLVPTSPVTQTSVTDQIGNQTVYRFNTSGFLTDVTDANGQTRHFTRDPGTNIVTSASGSGVCPVCGDPSVGNLVYAYDANGNLLSQSDGLGNTWKNTFDPNTNEIVTRTDPLGNTSKFAYDGRGNLTSLKDQKGNTFTYTYDGNGLLLTSTDPAGGVVTNGYDTTGNIISITDQLGNVNRFSYDGASRSIQSKDALNNLQVLTYDALDRITQVTDGDNRTVKLSYDPVGGLLTVTDAANNITTFTHDALDRINQRKDPLGRVMTYTYDSAGRLLTQTDRLGHVQSYTYDPVNRLVTQTYVDATVKRTYDVNSRLVQMDDSQAGQFTFSYDAGGKLLKAVSPFGNIAFTYDSLDRTATRQVFWTGRRNLPVRCRRQSCFGRDAAGFRANRL